MAADLHIHIFKGITEDDLRDMNASTFGSKHFNLIRAHQIQSTDRSMELYDKISKTPDVHVGEVSWLKAAVTGDADAYVPPTVEKVSEIIGEDLPVIDDALIDRITMAFKIPNETGYCLSNFDDVLAFLREHRGERAFTVSW